MKKIITIAMVICLSLVVFAARPAMGEANTLQGITVDSYDGATEFYDGTSYYGNITALHPTDSDQAVNNGLGGTDFAGYDLFQWMADGGLDETDWNTVPGSGEVGETVYFVGEYNGYVWSTDADIQASLSLKDPQSDMFARYEPIPTPQLNPNAPGSVQNGVGSSWINISIEHFKYSDYNNTAASQTGHGTYDNFHSYAVFVQGSEYATWTHVGNSYQDPNRLPVDPPIDAYGDGQDPSLIDTGADCFNITGLAGGEYNITVRVNFGPAGAFGGYGGGLGSYTTWGAGGTLGPINTPEFGTGMLIPVVATIGMFAAFTIYRRKKEN